MMRCSSFTALCLAAAIAGIVPARAQQQPAVLGTAQTEDVDGWNGAVLATEDGSFARCSVTTQDQNGAAIKLTLAADGNLRLDVSSSRWNTEKPGESIAISYWLDRGSPRSIAATVVDANTLEFDITGDLRLVQQLQLARTLFVLNRGVQYEFNLGGSAQSVQWLYRCTERNSGATFENIVFEKPKEEPEAVQEAAAPGRSREVNERLALAEATALMANMLSNASVADFKITIDEEADSGVSWSAPEGSGTIALISAEEIAKVDSIRAELVGAAAVNCNGTFSSKRHDTEGAHYMLVKTECAGGAQSESKLLAAVETEAGGALMLVEAKGDAVPVIDRLLASIRSAATGASDQPAGKKAANSGERAADADRGPGRR